MKIYYCVLKNYKGIFKKTLKGNTHLFIIPTEDKYIYLGLLGEIVDNPGSYACQLILRFEPDLLDTIIDGEEDYFGDRFLELEELDCTSTKVGSGDYKLHIPTKGNYIHSSLRLTYNVEYSTDKQRIYIMEGKLNFEADDVDPSKDLRLIAKKQMAFIGDKGRFSDVKKKNASGGLKMSNDRKLIEYATKMQLLEVVKNSEVLKKKLSTEQIIKLGAIVSGLPYLEVVSILAFDGKQITNEQLKSYESMIQRN